MDTQFIKWRSDSFQKFASNLEQLNSFSTWLSQTQDWTKLNEKFPSLSAPPFSPADMEKAHREWLAMMGGVPRTDYDRLLRKNAGLEAECGQLRGAVNQLTKTLAGFEDLPRAVSPWVEMANKTMESHLKWLNSLRASEKDKNAGQPRITRKKKKKRRVAENGGVTK